VDEFNVRGSVLSECWAEVDDLANICGGYSFTKGDVANFDAVIFVSGGIDGYRKQTTTLQGLKVSESVTRISRAMLVAGLRRVAHDLILDQRAISPEKSRYSIAHWAGVPELARPRGSSL
jgi:hypothetical protein